VNPRGGADQVKYVCRCRTRRGGGGGVLIFKCMSGNKITRSNKTTARAGVGGRAEGDE
jgi:hypothetical protein